MNITRQERHTHTHTAMHFAWTQTTQTHTHIHDSAIKHTHTHRDFIAHLALWIALNLHRCVYVGCMFVWLCLTDCLRVWVCECESVFHIYSGGGGNDSDSDRGNKVSMLAKRNYAALFSSLFMRLNFIKSYGFNFLRIHLQSVICQKQPKWNIKEFSFTIYNSRQTKNIKWNPKCIRFCARILLYMEYRCMCICLYYLQSYM